MNIEILGLSELTKKEALEINGGQISMESSFGQDVGTILGAVVGAIAEAFTSPRFIWVGVLIR